jgi:hypothetical protein
MLLGPLPALSVYLGNGYTHFYQANTPESVMWACGYGLNYPTTVPAPLEDFLKGARHSLECSDLGPVEIAGPATYFALGQIYLTWGSAILWRTFDIDYRSLAPLVFVLMGAYGAGVYALSRLFLGRTLSAIGAITLILSPVALSMILVLRDFSKAPFFIWTIVLLLCALRADSLRGVTANAGIAGIVLGLGFGFRSDLMVLLPIGVVMLVIGANGGSVSLTRRSGVAAAAVALFVCAALLVSAPVWMRSGPVAKGGGWVIQGASETFRSAQGLHPAAYALGWFYSDELTLSTIAVTARESDPGWDAREIAADPMTEITQAGAVSTDYLMSWADLFAADFIAQAIKAGGWVLGLPALASKENAITARPIPKSPLTSQLGNAFGKVYGYVATPWIILVSGSGLLVLLFRVFLRSRAEALALTVLLTFLMTYPGIQFAVRHLFHLEFIWVIATLSLLTSLPTLLRSYREIPVFAAYCAVSILVGAGAYLAAILYQQDRLSQELARLIELPRASVPSSETAWQDDGRLLVVEIPPEHAPLVRGPKDSLVPSWPFKGLRSDVRAAADRMIVTVSGQACPMRELDLLIKYAHTESTWQPFDARLRPVTPPTADRVSFVFPAFYRPSQWLQGIILQKRSASCMVKIERILGHSRLPLMLIVGFDGDAPAGPLYKGIGSFSLDPQPRGVAEAAPP